MAGHSKWANIKHKKAATDAKRSKVWTRLIKEITVAAKLGGDDLNTNPRLRLAIDKGAQANMPKDNINRAIARGVGSTDNVNYEQVRYEGYGIAGAAVIVDCLTDNRTRTVAEVRHAFNKYGGNMGNEGSVAFIFNACGSLVFNRKDDDKLIELCIEQDVQDIIEEEDCIEILCDQYKFMDLKSKLEQHGFISEFSEVGMKPQNTVDLNEQDSVKMQKIIDALENLDDVQEVYHNAIMIE
jgi:YebC/PmpR family DNA-binding regulatory protein